MKMKFMTKAAACAVGLVLASVTTSHAVLTMTISDGTTEITVNDGGANDLYDDVTGKIAWKGAIGVWTINVETGTSKPVIGSPTEPALDVNIDSTSSTAGTLTLTLIDTDFGPLASQTGIGILTGGGKMSSGGGKIDAKGYLVNGSSSSFVVDFNPVIQDRAWSGTEYGTADLGTSVFALKEVVTLTHYAKGQTTGDIEFDIAVPEPGTILAGALLLLPFGATALRIIRKKRE